VKRLLVFAYSSYEAMGGWNDFYMVMRTASKKRGQMQRRRGRIELARTLSIRFQEKSSKGAMMADIVADALLRG